MRVLVACEFSGTVREAFRRKGHNAWSCDLQPTEIPGHHYQTDIKTVLSKGWDMMIGFPPCTHLCVSGARYFWYKEKEQLEAIKFFCMLLLYKGIAKIAIENPIGIMSTEWRKPDQIIQPWMFGHQYTKATCLWLKGLPKLRPTNIIANPIPHQETVHEMWATFGFENRELISNERSRTYDGIAEAMADQWG